MFMWGGWGTLELSKLVGLCCDLSSGRFRFNTMSYNRIMCNVLASNLHSPPVELAKCVFETVTIESQSFFKA